MQIVKKDLKKGVIALKLQTLDDLWHLEKVIEPGDMVRAKTTRRLTLKRGEDIVKAERKPVTLTVAVEKVSFHETGRLRAGGKISEGPEDMSGSHTIDLKPDMTVTVTKKAWKPQHMDRLERAKVKEPLLFICVVDRERADFGGLKASGLEMLGSKSFRKVKKGEEEEKRESWHREIMDHLAKQEKYQRIILAGPGFEAENIYGFIQHKDPGLYGRIALEKASVTGRAGLQEVIKRSADKVLANTRVARETKAVEDLMAEIGRDGLAVYGKKETRHAAEMGAVETLLVSEQAVRDHEPLIDMVEKQKGKVMILSSSHEAGERFVSLGGIAGFLRFRLH
jgi:protein pelota